jgi:hypothetical protein
MRLPPLWISLVPLAAAAALLGVGISEGAQRARRPEEVVWVDPSAVALDGFPDWADPRWKEEFLARLAALPPFPAGDAEALAELADELASLSFVAHLDPPSVDGAADLRLGFRLRRPVAALPVRGHFLTVDAEGVVLSGAWPSPPRSGALWLPVILPPSAAGGEALDFDVAHPGDWLDTPECLAALDTAVSLGSELSDADLERLGRVAIDGAGYDVRGPEDPGVLILLEGQRLIVYGRPPSSAAPGELPAAAKWRSVSAALEELALGGPGSFFDLVDVRWDVPEFRYPEGFAEPVLAAALPAAEPSLERGYPASWATQAPPEEPATRSTVREEASPSAWRAPPARAEDRDRPRVR